MSTEETNAARRGSESNDLLGHRSEARPLVDRLRHRAHNGIAPMHELARLDMLEAAAEIDRQRARVLELEAVHEDASGAILQAVAAERERLCAAIKAADDKASESDYMLDSNDCISVIRGTWNPGA